MTRVLLVSQYFWPESFVITAAAAGLADEGFQITVLTGQPNYPSGKVFPGYSALSIRREKINGIDVIRLPVIPRGKGSGLRLMLNYGSFIVAGFVLAPFLLRGRRFETVFVYGLSPLLQALPAVLLSRMKRAPLIIWVQDLWPESLAATGFIRNAALLRIVRFLVRIIYRNCARILVQSEAFRHHVATLAPPNADIHFVPNPGQTMTSNTPPSDAAFVLGEKIAQGFSVVFAGNLGHAQGLDTVLDAVESLRDLPDLQVYLVGSGSLDSWLERERTQRNLVNLHLPGRFTTTDMPVILAKASALLVSLRKEDIFSLTVPSKLQTYLSTGRPVIGSLDGEGARILAEASAGLVAPAGDALALATAIRNMASLPASERSAMGLSGQRYFDMHFALDHIMALLSGHLTAATRKVARHQGD